MVPIKKDNDVWYLTFSNNVTNRHSLIAHVSVDSLEEYSSTVSSVRDNVEMLNIGFFLLFQMMKL